MQNNTLPQNWQRYTLGDIYTERKEPGNDFLPVLSVSIHSGVSDGELDEEELGKKIKRIEDKSQYRKAMKGDLVFNMMRAWQGAIGVVRTDGQVSPAYIVAKPNEKVYPPFMDYYMKTPRMIHSIHRQSYGVTDFRLRLYWDSFAPIPCVIPPLEEQKKITEILAAQDRVIALYNQKIEQLRLLKKYCLKKMFPKQGSNVPEIRFPGFTDPWEQHKMSQIVTVCSGRDYRHLSKGSIPVYGTGGYMLSVNEALSYDRDAIGIGRKGTIDKPYVLKAPFWTVDTLFYAIPDCPKCLDFVYAVFQMVDWKKKDESTGLPSLSKEAINDTDVMISKTEEQIAIGGFFSLINNIITLNQFIRQEEEKKKKRLQQLLLSGIVRVE